MTRNLKVLGLALVAVLAMSAMVASAASAASFTSATAPVTITANQTTTHKFSVTGLGVTCETASFHGSVAATSVSSVTITPTYTGCRTDVGELSTKVTGFGHYGESSTCKYVLHASGTADLSCAAGAQVTIDAGTCTIHIPAQTGLSSVSYSNNANGTIGATININNVSGSHTDGFLCPFNGSGPFTNGILTGSSTVSGETSEGAAIAVSHDK